MRGIITMLKIVISPAKKMNITDEFPCNATVPVFSDRADVLHGILKNKNIQELKTLWKCSQAENHLWRRCQWR